MNRNDATDCYGTCQTQEGKWYRPKAQTPWRTMKRKSEKAQRMNPGYYQAPKTLVMDEDGLRVPRKDR
jgi:hypothetical protein